MACPSCLGVAATDEEDVVAELARSRSRVVHLHLEMAEDQRRLDRLAHDAAERLQLGAGVLPVLADVGLSVLAAHCLDVDLRMAAEHLDAQVELQNAGAGEIILQRVLQASDQRRE